MSKRARPYEEFLHERLAASVEEAVEYLNACLEDEDPQLFFVALQDVIEARGGLAKLVDDAAFARQLTTNANPSISSINSLLDKLNMRLVVSYKEAA
jgi:DNA-binding phage protein